jgi:FkbM family methyltransferase
MKEHLVRIAWWLFISVGRTTLRTFWGLGFDIKPQTYSKLISVVRAVLALIIPDRVHVEGINLWLGRGIHCKIRKFEYVVGYERFAIQMLKDHFEKGDYFIDIGAHIGYFSLVASRLVGSKGRVYAFEPEPNNFAQLLKNIEANGCNNIVPLQKAVSNVTGICDLRLDKQSGCHSLYLAPEQIGTIKVDTTTLDDFFSMERWPSISLIKMDAQGGEGHILEGARNLLKRNPNLKMIIEWWAEGLEAAGVLPQSFLEKLQSLGFNVLVIDEKYKILLPIDSCDLRTGVNLLAVRNNVVLEKAKFYRLKI